MPSLIVLFLSVSSWFAPDLGTVRSAFEKADKSKDATTSLYNSLKDYERSDAVLLAYKGAATVLYARYQNNQNAKKKLVIEGIKTLESAVKIDSDNIEIRLVRLIIQENSPKILKYKTNISADKQIILTNFTKQSKAVKEIIKRYASQRSKLFTAAELRTLN